MLHDEGSTIVALYQNWIHGISHKVDTGGELLGTLPLDGLSAFEKWSLKA